MRRLLFIIILISSNQVTWADSDSTGFKNQFSVDVTPLIKQFIDFNNSQNPYTAQYWFSYKRGIKNNNAIRLLIGGNRTEDKHTVSNPWPGTPNTASSHSYAIISKLGFEWRRAFAKRWQAFYGIDSYLSYSEEYSNNDYQNGSILYGHKSGTYLYGAAPVCGMNFYLNKRLMLSTEASFVFAAYRSINEILTSPITPSQENTTHSRGTRVYLNSPVSLFIGYNF
jgi:hypothetical protein